MARFTVVLAVLFAAALMAATSTSAYKTVVTTTVAEEMEENQGGCQWERQQCQMRHCMQLLRSMTGPYEDSFVRSEVANQGQFGQLRECCNELRNVQSQCRCEALRCMMRQMQQQYGMEQEMQQMMQKAEYLPRMCGLTYPTQCRMHPIFA
ncbi:2S seed storage protein 1 [Sesamum alatum]|uniref:2S seed storage protein 1 n=1 Tax=Sesamum alatum TaxID=300844 RepID=A0AAE1Z0Z3_9LAMI|nr:2S seed storage protein 1 [Sesamum alatum]